MESLRRSRHNSNFNMVDAKPLSQWLDFIGRRNQLIRGRGAHCIGNIINPISWDLWCRKNEMNYKSKLKVELGTAGNGNCTLWTSPLSFDGNLQDITTPIPGTWLTFRYESWYTFSKLLKNLGDTRKRIHNNKLIRVKTIQKKTLLLCCHAMERLNLSAKGVQMQCGAHKIGNLVDNYSQSSKLVCK